METSRFKFRQFAHVEPILFVYSHWLFLMIPVVNQYLYYRISEDVGFPYLNLTAEGDGGCSEEKFGGNSSLRELETEVTQWRAMLCPYTA
jgi:PCFT/HCP family folate transporter-like MFS transporter 1/3